jgi:hypothetical protein
VPDPRSRRGLPERWLLPPPPRDAELTTRWHDLPFDRRRTLAHVGPDDVTSLPEADREVVAGLARARLVTSWRLLLGAPLLGWLVLMTIWGFGRSTYPASERAWLLGGLFLGALVWFLAALWVARRLRRARAVLAAATTDPGEEP